MPHLSNTLFIVPNNDAESIKIQEILERNGQEYAVTGQPWGATWEKLEDNIKERIDKYEQVYGIELNGNVPQENCKNILDWSLREVSKLLGVELSTEELFYEANDRGYVPEMMKLGASLNLPDEYVSEMIEKVNNDEAKAQGVTEEMKELAQKAVDNGYIYDDRLIWIDVPDFRLMREVTNILYRMGKHKDMTYQTTVIDTHDQGHRVIVFSNRNLIDILTEEYTENSWNDGGGEEKLNGYFGIQVKDETTKEKIAEEIRNLLEDKILGYHRLIEREDIIASRNCGPNLNIHEINDPAVFHKTITKAKEENEHGAFVHTYESDEYKDMKLFVVNAGAAGIAVKKDGDVVSVFKNSDMAKKDDIEKINKELLVSAIGAGGKKLDCFDGFLPELYSRFGFIPVCRIRFNDEFAPEGWDFERDGRPNIIFMAHNGDTVPEILEKQKRNEYTKYEELKESVPYVDDYDLALEKVALFLKQQEETKQELTKEGKMR